MHKQPVLILCIGFILGIIFREYLVISSSSAVILFIFSLVPLLSYFSKSVAILRLKRYLLPIPFFFFGVLLHAVNSKKPVIPHLDHKENIIFKLDKKLISNERNRRYEVVMYKGNSSTGSVLSVPKSLPELDFIHLYRAELYINPVVHPKNDYQFDYAKYLQRRSIFFQSYLPGSYQITERRTLDFSERIKQERLELLQKIDRTSISPKSREFLKGMILADRTEMDRDTVSDFTKTGLVHILAISGSHIVIIFGIFFWLLLRVFPAGLRNHAIILSLGSIWTFAVFIGFGNSVVRSCIMITVYFIYILLQRKPDLLHSMALAAFIILIWDTTQIFDVGFQLSFLAVFGIYWLNQPVLDYFPKHDNLFKRVLFNTLSISLAAQFATMPLVLYYFHQFSLVSIPANLVIIPLSEVIIVFSLFMTFIIGFEVNFYALSYIYDLFIQVVLQLISWFSTLDRFLFYNVPMSLAEVALMGVIIYLLRFLILMFDLRNLMRMSFILLIYFAVHFGLNHYQQRRTEVMIHHHFKEKYFSVKEKGKVTFWIREDADLNKVQKYIIDPYLTSRRAGNSEIKLLPSGTETVRYNGKLYPLED